MIGRMKAWAKKLKRQIFVLYFACKDERVPWYAKLFTAFVVAYAFSPIDLVPDFIPVLGYLDDLVLVPLGIVVALKLIPRSVIPDCEMKAEEMMKRGKPKNWIAASIIVMIWGLVLIGAGIQIYYLFY